MKQEKTVEILVRGVCVKKGRLLVCQSKGARNTFLPGGHVEFGEKATAALAREIEEEMGLKSRVGCFLGAVEHEFIQKGRRHCEVNLMFQMDVPSLTPDTDPTACEHWISFKWIPLTALGRNHLEPWPLRTLVPSWLKANSGTCRWGSTVGHS